MRTGEEYESLGIFNFIFSRCSILRKGSTWLKNWWPRNMILVVVLEDLDIWETKYKTDWESDSGIWEWNPQANRGLSLEGGKTHLSYFSRENWEDLVSTWMRGWRQASWSKFLLPKLRAEVSECHWWDQTQWKRVSWRRWDPQMLTSLASNVDMILNEKVLILGDIPLMQPCGGTSRSSTGASYHWGKGDELQPKWACILTEQGALFWLVPRCCMSQ